MEEGVPRSFIQLFCVPRSHPVSLLPSGFRDDRCGRWLDSSPSHLVHLNVGKYGKIYHYPIHNFPIHNHPEVSLAPFYGLLPVHKSIRLAFNLFQNSQISVLIHPSFLHKDLALSGRTIGNGGPYPDTDVDGPSSNFRLCPHLPVPSTSSYSKRWNTSSVGYCAHKTVFNLESSDCRGLRRMAFDG